MYKHGQSLRSDLCNDKRCSLTPGREAGLLFAALLRPDGKIVVVYYWLPEKDKERTFEATIWDPGSATQVYDV
jgi:hypothetical protein